MLIAHAQKRVCVYSDKIIVNKLGTFKRRLRTTSHNWNKNQNGDITLAAHRREAQCVPNIIFFDVCCLRCDVERCFKLAPPAVRADQTGRQRRDVLNVSRPFVLCYRTCERDIFWKRNKPILMRARRICGTAQTCAALITTAGPLSNAIKRPCSIEGERHMRPQIDLLAASLSSIELGSGRLSVHTYISFYRAMLCRHPVSVCLSVTFVSCAKTNKDISLYFGTDAR